MAFCGKLYQQKGKSSLEIAEEVLARSQNRQLFYEKLLKLFIVSERKNLRLILENPYSVKHYLHHNFPYEPALIDRNRALRGDYYIKPTQYFFLGCTPLGGETYCPNPHPRTIRKSKCSPKGGGICSQERSEIHPLYAKLFIADFILGETLPEYARQLTLNL